MYIVTATVTPLVLTMVTCQLSLPLGPLAVAVVVGLVGQAFASRELDTLCRETCASEVASRIRQWAGLDSNQGPTDYESAALTS